MMICTQMTINRERQEFIQSKEIETRRIILYIQADMHKRSIEREENIRQDATSLFFIIIEIPTFLSCRYVACRQSFSRHFNCRRFHCRRFHWQHLDTSSLG